jgi:hypothetical protein
VRFTPPSSDQFPKSEVRIACWSANGLCTDKDPLLELIEQKYQDLLCLKHKLQETHADEREAKTGLTVTAIQMQLCLVRRKRLEWKWGVERKRSRDGVESGEEMIGTTGSKKPQDMDFYENKRKPKTRFQTKQDANERNSSPTCRKLALSKGWKPK